METVISGQWWRSHQSLAGKGSCFQILCDVLEWWIRTQNIKYCLGATVECVSKIHHNTEQIAMVQIFFKIQKLWTQSTENQWNSSGIFPRIHFIGARQESQKVHEQMGEPEQFQGRIVFMSMFNDILWGYKDNETECIANSTLVSLFAKRFPAGRWSFLGPGSETKLYSTNKERPGGKWDRVAELMMIKFGLREQIEQAKCRCRICTFSVFSTSSSCRIAVGRTWMGIGKSTMEVMFSKGWGRPVPFGRGRWSRCGERICCARLHSVLVQSTFARVLIRRRTPEQGGSFECSLQVSFRVTLRVIW